MKRVFSNVGEHFRNRFSLWPKILIWLSASLIIVGVIFIIKFVDSKNKAYNELVDSTLNVDTFYPGIYVQQVDLSGKTKEEAITLLTTIEPELRDTISITVTCMDKSFYLTEDNLEFTFDTQNIIDQAFEIGRVGSREERFQTVQQLAVSPINFNISSFINLEADSIKQFVDTVAQEVRIDMKPPFISEFNPDAENMFVKHEGIPGVELDSESLEKQILDSLYNKDYSVQINATTHPIPVVGSLSDLDYQTVLVSDYSTISTNSYNGNVNMALAMAAVNGSVIAPGEYFSFNSTTGDTTSPERGYLPSGAIVNGKLVQEYGGGICQAATTIYGAAMRANMNITTRYNHRWPSSYVPIGQDATVDYPGTDFCFQNDSDYPVFIKASMSGTTLNAKFYGYHPDNWDNIEVVSRTVEVIPQPAAQYIEDSSLLPGEEVVDSYGYTGYKTTGERILYKSGEVVKVDPIHSSYYKEGATIIRKHS